MKSLYNERIIPLTLLGIIVILGLTLFSVNDNLLGLSGESNQPLYATNKDFFTQETIATTTTAAITKQVVLSDNFPQGTIVSPAMVALTIRTNEYEKPRFTHNKAYFSYKGAAWQTINLEPASSQSQQGNWNDVWIRGPAQGTINVELADSWDLHTAYLVTYSCTLHAREDIEDSQELLSEEKEIILDVYFGSANQAYLCGFDEQKVLDKWNLLEQTINIGTPIYIAGFETQQATTSPGEEVTGYWFLYGAGVNPECALTTSPQIAPEDIIYDNEHGLFSFTTPQTQEEELVITLTCENEFHKTTKEKTILIGEPTTPVNAECGSNAQQYDSDVSSWPNTNNNAFCAQGTLQGSTPEFPQQGQTTTWMCAGIEGGSDKECSASREEIVYDWDILSATHEQSYDLSPQETIPRGMYFSTDGTRLFTSGTGQGADMNQYALSTPWDVSTITYQKSWDQGTTNPNPAGIQFTPDGRTMYFFASTGNYLYRYRLSTPWDVSTLSYTQDYKVFSGMNLGSGFFLDDSRTRLFLIQLDYSAGHKILTYELTSPGQISSAQEIRDTTINQAFSYPTSIYFQPDGRRLYITDYDGAAKTVYQFSLSTPWDTSSAQLEGTLDISSQERFPYSMYIRDDAEKLYIVGSEEKKIHQYALS